MQLDFQQYRHHCRDSHVIKRHCKGHDMTESNKQTLTLQRGFTLVELSISMVLIVSLMLAGFYIIKRIRIDAAVNATIASANLSMNKANAAFAGTDNTFGANTTTLYAMNVWPKERVVTATNASGVTSVVSVKGQFSGSEEMMWTDGGNSSPAYSGFIYYFKNIPSEACLPLIKNLSMHPNARTIRAAATSSVKPTVNFGAMSAAQNVKTGGGGLSLGLAATQCLKGDWVDVAVQFDKS
jgi:prepilin-type N-terminal cleavage/methylation domain-containing protein